MAASITVAQADPAPVKYEETVALFRHAGKSAAFFHHSYAYAVFPNIGEGAFIVGGAGGKGGVFVGGQQIGVATLAKVSVGFQAGGKDFSEIIFFEDKRALDEFESGNFEFGADASVIAITAARTRVPERAAPRRAQAAARRMREPRVITTREWWYSPSPRAASCIRRPSPARSSRTSRLADRAEAARGPGGERWIRFFDEGC